LHITLFGTSGAVDPKGYDLLAFALQVAVHTGLVA
jgi:hypothetical protein